MEFTNAQTAGQKVEADARDEPGEAVRVARGISLDELPGAAFAAVTSFWIASSLAGLMWRDMSAETIVHLQQLAQAVLGSHALATVSRVAAATSFAKSVYGFFDPRSPA